MFFVPLLLALASATPNDVAAYEAQWNSAVVTAREAQIRASCNLISWPEANIIEARIRVAMQADRRWMLFSRTQQEAILDWRDRIYRRVKETRKPCSFYATRLAAP